MSTQQISTDDSIRPLYDPAGPADINCHFDAFEAWHCAEYKEEPSGSGQPAAALERQQRVCLRECVSIVLVGDVTQCPPTCSKHGPDARLTSVHVCVCVYAYGCGLFPSLTESSFNLRLN